MAMTPDQVREAQRRLGLSDAGLARFLGVSQPVTIRRWKAGRNPVPGPASLALRYALDRQARGEPPEPPPLAALIR